jgi:predicted Holliday junction resolvase-like endonuclease
MNLELFLKNLKTSELMAQCPKCDKEFNLSDSVLFDGTKAFPEEAMATRLRLMHELTERTEDLEKRQLSADVTSEKKAVEIGFGKIIERFIPAYKDLNLQFAECRPLFDPIDIIVFNGLLDRNVDHITFLEIKSGNSDLNKHQRLIRDAIAENKVDVRIL